MFETEREHESYVDGLYVRYLSHDDGRVKRRKQVFFQALDPRQGALFQHLHLR